MPRKTLLDYETPVQGKHYWVKDGALKDPNAATTRCLKKEAWILGAPHRQESWPGMRSPDALTPAELAGVESWIVAALGIRSLAPGDPRTSHNFAQLVGGGDSVARPHVDHREYCDLAGVLYLHPYPATKHGGTSFYRLRAPDGTLDGNLCPPAHSSLATVFGNQKVPLHAWEEEVEVTNVYNRLLVYRPDLVHSATSYFGTEFNFKRLTAVFFWKMTR